MAEREEIAQLIRDLSEIRAAVRRNQSILREMVEGARFELYIVMMGIAVSAVALLFTAVTRSYGAFAEAPPGVRALLFGLVALTTIGFSFWKWRVMRSSVGSNDGEVGPWKAVASFYRGPFLPYLVPLLVLTGGVITYLALSGNGSFIVGTTAIASGLLLNDLSSRIRAREYYLFGFWLMAGGAVSFFLRGIAGGVWCAIIYGGACLVFFLAAEIGKLVNRARQRGRE